MAGDRLAVGVVGCGNIAGPYAESMKVYPELTLVGSADALPERAKAYAKAHGGRAYGSIDELLGDPAIECVVNLTPYVHHAEVTVKALEAGKHVFSEKPLATTFEEASRIRELARSRKRRVACAPITFMGEAQQTAAKLMREGRIGDVKLIYAEVNHGRIEAWHPAPEVFYQGGPMYDVGVYPTALATAFFGPAKRVSAFGKVLLPNRLTKDGKPFALKTPDCFIASIELAGGPVIRLTANFYVQGSNTRQGECMEFHGDKGSLAMDGWFGFASGVHVGEWNKPLKPAPLVRKPSYPQQAVEWSRALKELVDAEREDRPHRASLEHAVHVVEVITAVSASAAKGGAPVELTSTFDRPEPMPWAT